MRTDDLGRAITAAIIHLEWLNADRYRGAHDLLGKTRINPDDHTGRGSSAPGRRSIGGHSDPTGDTVASAADRQAQLADHHDTITDTARWIRTTTGPHQPPAPAPATLTRAIGDLTWCITIPHLITNWRPPTDEDRRELHHAVELVHLEAQALQTEVEQALRYSATMAAGRPEPKLITCACCTRWGYREPAVRGGLCEVCAAFRADHKCWPTKSIRDDRAMGRKRIRPAQLAEARAARKRRRSA